jgi:glyoxylase-like metal-dependent hydrolase (beta-lactamase superfamily II)
MEPGLAFYLEMMDMKAPKSNIQRITASNGSVFTGPGTNSYLIGTDDITLVDPGPKIDAHLSNLLELGKNKIKRILVTHTHPDHSPGAKVLAEKLKIPLMGRLVAKDIRLRSFIRLAMHPIICVISLQKKKPCSQATI